MKLGTREIYENNMLMGAHKMKVHPEYLKYNIVDFVGKLSFIKLNKCVASIYAALKQIDFNKQTLIFVDDVRLHDEVKEICSKNNKFGYLLESWPSGLMTNPSIINNAFVKKAEMKRTLLETVNKQSRAILGKSLEEKSKFVQGIKQNSSFEQVIFIGTISPNIIAECQKIKIVALCNTENQISKIHIPIFCNSYNYFAKQKILQLISNAINKNK